MDFMPFGPFGGLWLLLALAMQLAVLVLVVLGIVWLVRKLGAGGGAQRRESSALDELEVRYARGEIDRTTYLQMREDLSQRASG
jgi:putative membrane protein